MEKICKNITYINSISKDTQDIDKELLEKALKALKRADCIMLYGKGRSQLSLYIGLRGLLGKEIKTLEDVDFPGRTIDQAAPIWEQNYENIVLLVNSGSGETKTVKAMVDRLAEYIKKTKSKKFFIIAVGSYLTSSIAKKIKQVNGVFLKLKGRERDVVSSREYSFYGIMADKYELSSLLLFQEIKQAINQDKNVHWIFEQMYNDMKLIGKDIDKYFLSEQCAKLAENMMSQRLVVFGGLGPAEQVAKMTGIRIEHLILSIRGEIYLTGQICLPPLPGQVFVAISWSGETEPTEWADDYLKNRGIVFSITGNESTLSKKTQSFIIKTNEDKFYMRAAFLLSILAIKFCDELLKYGIDVPETLMKRLGHAWAE